MQGRQEYQPELFATVDIEAMIPKNHLLRRLDRLLDLSFIRDLTKEFYCDDNGRPSIDPELFIRMCLIGHFYNIDSDRRLCEEIQFNLAYRWYAKISLNDSVPDHSSMTRIRDRLGEETFKTIFLKVIELCEEKGLIKSEKVMVDSSLVRADAALDSLKRIDGTDEGPWHAKGKKYSNQTHVSGSDPEATLTNKTGVHKALYHKVHAVADAKTRIVLDAHVTTGSVHDTVIFKDQITRLLKRMNIREVTADRGYGSAENLMFLSDKKIRSYIPLWKRSVGHFEEGFTYDSKKDRFRCPEGKFLDKLHGVKDDCKVYRASVKVCSLCPRYKTCVPDGDRNSGRGKRIRRNIHQPIFNQVLWREKTSLFKAKLHQRMWSMEGLYAESKTFHGLDRARYRGVAKLQIQAYMVFSVLNLKRLLASLGQFIKLLLAYGQIFRKSRISRISGEHFGKSRLKLQKVA